MSQLGARLEELKEWKKQCQQAPYLKPHLTYVQEEIGKVEAEIRKQKIAGLTQGYRKPIHEILLRIAQVFLKRLQSVVKRRML
jgi:hypothetical protein